MSLNTGVCMAWRELFLCVCVCVCAHYPQTHVLRCPSNCLSCSMDIFCKEGWQVRWAPACTASGLTVCEMFDSSSVTLPFSACLSAFSHSCIWPCEPCWMFYHSSSATCWKVINGHQYIQRQYLFKDSQGQLENPWSGGWHDHKSMTYSSVVCLFYFLLLCGVFCELTLLNCSITTLILEFFHQLSSA